MPKDPNDQILETLADINQAIGDRFDKVDIQFGETRQRFDRVEGELTELQTTMDRQFDDVRDHLERIEKIILEEHARRIEALERKVGIGR